MTECRECKNEGRCAWCRGSGRDRWDLCYRCNGTGLCYACDRATSKKPKKTEQKTPAPQGVIEAEQQQPPNVHPTPTVVKIVHDHLVSVTPQKSVIETQASLSTPSPKQVKKVVQVKRKAATLQHQKLSSSKESVKQPPTKRKPDFSDIDFILDKPCFENKSGF